MNTLKEIGDFVGIPRGSLKVSGYGGPWITSLGKVSLLVMAKERPATMRAIIQLLQNLTPITLEAQIVGGSQSHYDRVMRLNASGGIPWFTTIISQNEKAYHMEVESSGGDFIFGLGVGTWQISVERAGISNTGFVSLSKTLGTITVSDTRQPEPPPADHHPPPPADHPPTISAVTEGAGAGTILVVTGSGFLPNKTVTVRVVDAVFHERNFQQSSTMAGELKMRISLPCNSGLPIHVSATDSRPAPGILGVLFSNYVTLPCP